MAATRSPASLLPTCIQFRRAKSYRVHRVLGQVVAQFQFLIFQEAAEPTVAMPLLNGRLLSLEESPLIKGNGVLPFIGGMRPLIGGRSVTPFC
jgi:hypothetical protein